MTGIAYENVFDFNGHPVSKKTPWIEHKGNQIADSTKIIEYLTKEFKLEDWRIEMCHFHLSFLSLSHFSVTMDDGLTELQRAKGLVVQRTLEEHFYWTGVHSTFVCLNLNSSSHMIL